MDHRVCECVCVFVWVTVSMSVIHAVFSAECKHTHSHMIVSCYYDGSVLLYPQTLSLSLSVSLVFFHTHSVSFIRNITRPSHSPLCCVIVTTGRDYYSSRRVYFHFNVCVHVFM